MTKHSDLPKPDMNPINLMAFGFGSGCTPKAPGTMGTLFAVGLYLPLSHLPLEWYIAMTIAVSLVGIFICGWSAKDLGVHDHPGIVWDEFAGYFITMIAAPTGWQWIVIGFVLFRFFDILKPWPISLADKKLKGGFGIMFDDILAGLAALGCMQALAHYAPVIGI
jgi:phosphatidylglycerophosphatase A